MSKTWRRGEKGASCRRERRGAERRGEDCRVEMPAAQAEPRRITPEWAVARIADRLGFILEKFISDELISLSDRDYYASLLTKSVLDALDEYDPDRKDANGRKCSASHFCLMVLDRRAVNIIENLLRYRRNAVEVPIRSLPEEDAEKFGYVSAWGLSDESRSVRELEFRMDVNTLRGMMTPLEIEIFDERMAGRTYDEIAGRLGFNRFKLARIMANLQKRARICGFFPQSEVRDGTEQKILEKSLHIFRRNAE